MGQSEHTSILISFDYWTCTVYLKSNLKEMYIQISSSLPISQSNLIVNALHYTDINWNKIHNGVDPDIMFTESQCQVVSTRVLCSGDPGSNVNTETPWN
jgi:hypothetical protein